SSMRRFVNVIVVHDADDARIGWNFGRVERKARLLAANEEHGLADARANRIHRDERPADVRSVGRDRLQHHQLDAREVVVLARDDDGANDFRELHQSPAPTSTASTMPTMAASTGQSFIPNAMRAELPLTMSTVSPTPASTVSTATR